MSFEALSVGGINRLNEIIADIYSKIGGGIGTITTEMIADEAITEPKIADGAVGAAKTNAKVLTESEIRALF